MNKKTKKIIKNKAGVSAVIGVVLMVAITIAIAVTVYVYVSGMGYTTNEEYVRQQITVDQNYTILAVNFKDIWDIRHIDRVEIIIMDFNNASIITISGFLFNINTDTLSYDDNSDLIKLKQE